MLVAISAISMLDLGGYIAALLFIAAAWVFFVAVRNKEFILTPVMLVIVAYILGYPLEALFSEIVSDQSHTTKEALEFGVPWAVRGFCAFALGYLLVATLGRSQKILAPRNESWFRDRICYTVFILTGVGWLVVLSWIISVMLFGMSSTFMEGNVVSSSSAGGTFQQVLSLLSSMRYSFIFVFLVMYYWKIADLHLIFLFAVLVGISAIEIVTIGSKASVIRGIVIVLLLGSILPIKLKVKQIFILITTLAVFYGSFIVITEYRAITQREYQAESNLLDIIKQAEIFGAALMASLPGDTGETEITKSDVFGRLSHVGSFSNLLEFTDRRPPYEHAWESLLVPVFSVMPRFFLPDKPEFFHSGRYATEYYGWEYGGISVTLLGSLYFAWGYVGIVLGMAFLGGLLSYIENRVRLWSIYSPHWLILHVVFILMLMDVGVIFQAIISNLVRIGLVLWVIHLFFPLVWGSMRLRTLRIVAAVQGNKQA